MKPTLLLILVITISSQLRFGNGRWFGSRQGREGPVPADANIHVGVNVNTKDLPKAAPGWEVLQNRLIKCFDPSTTVELANGQEIAVEKLHAGDQIVSCKSVDNCGSRYVDHVTDVIVIEEDGPFPAHNFAFENNKQINVTSPHIMYVYKEENGKMIPVTTAAKDVKVQDLMKFIDGTFSRVVQVIDFKLAKKVSINTAGGSFFANEVLTSGMCESYHEDDLNVLATPVLTSYADSHEGFNNCILAQKDLSLSPNGFAPACLSQIS